MGNKKKATQDIDAFETGKFGDSAPKVAQHSKTIPGKIYYGNDGLIKRNGVWVEDTSKYKGGSKQV